MSLKDDLLADKGKLKRNDIQALAEKYGFEPERVFKKANKLGIKLHESAEKYASTFGQEQQSSATTSQQTSANNYGQAPVGSGITAPGQETPEQNNSYDNNKPENNNSTAPANGGYPTVEPGAGAVAPGQDAPEQTDAYNQGAPKPAPAVNPAQEDKPELKLGQAIEQDKGKLKGKEIQQLAQDYGVSVEKVLKKAEKKGATLGGSAREKALNWQAKQNNSDETEEDRGTEPVGEDEQSQDPGGTSNDGTDQGQGEVEDQQSRQQHEQDMQDAQIAADKAEADAQRQHEADMQAQQARMSAKERANFRMDKNEQERKEKKNDIEYGFEKMMNETQGKKSFTTVSKNNPFMKDNYFN